MVICINNKLSLKNIPENYINIQPSLISLKKIKFKSKFYKLLKIIRERKYNKLIYNITIILIIIILIIIILIIIIIK
jgi:hypothetical protein